MKKRSLLVLKDDVSTDTIPNILGNILVKGTKYLWNIQLNQISTDQILKLRQYLWSIGYDVEYDIQKQVKVVVDYLPDGTPYNKELNINKFNILFKLWKP